MSEIGRLFAPGELDFRRTGRARLRELASGPAPRATARERRLQEDRATMERLHAVGADLARRFSLRAAVLEAERDGVNAHYGICYADGLIRIRLRHARTGKLLKESSLIDTLCHELAHLRHMNHGLRFRRLYARILDAARRLDYYRPGPADARPRQQLLFDPAGCGTHARPV